MRYVVLVSHGNFALGLNSALEMFVGSDRKDILSISLSKGMGVDVFEKKVNELLAGMDKDAEVIVLADIIGGSPLTTTLKVLSKNELLQKSVVFGGVNLPLAINAVLMKDSVGMSELKEVIINESKEAIKELDLNLENNEDEI